VPPKAKAVVTEYAWQTSSCIHCPTPPLQASDLVTWAPDVAAPMTTDAGRMGGYYGNFASWVLTAPSYGVTTKRRLSEDLDFS